ncbi:MAG: hypothetical protein R3B48_12270 [Kofleriaceae bacterium]
MTTESAALSWTWLCLPYVAATALVLVGGVAVVVQRGDRVLRIGLIGAASSVAPWALATAAAICAVEPATASALHRLASGPTMMLGPSLLLIFLSVSGQLDRYRRLARAATLCGVLLMTIAWSSPLILDGVWRIPSGIWYPKAGPLAWVQALQVGGWAGCGLVLALRAAPEPSRKSTLRFVTVLPALAMVATADTVLAYGYGGIYPLAWAPALAGGGISLYLAMRTPLLRSQGLDRAAAVELACLALAAAAIAAVHWLGAAGGGVAPIALAVLGAPLWCASLVVSWMIPREPEVPSEQQRFASELTTARDPAALLEALWGRQLGLVGVQIERQLYELGDPGQAFLAGFGQPLLCGELATLEVGAARQALKARFDRAHATVLVPVVYQGRLIAVVEARQPQPRLLLDTEKAFLYDSARLVGQRLVAADLQRNAEAAAPPAQEVELASILAAHHRPKFDEHQGPWLAVQHAASVHLGGAGWSWAPLDERRVAAMIADADAPGVAGTLLIAAMQGAFAARCREASCAAASLLDALRATLPEARRRTLVVVLDADAGTVSWAGDGHRGAAIVSRAGAPLLSELGAAEAGAAALPADAMVVLMSSAVLDAGGMAAALERTEARDVGLLASMVGVRAEPGGGSAALMRDQLVIGLVRRPAPA